MVLGYGSPSRRIQGELEASIGIGFSSVLLNTVKEESLSALGCCQEAGAILWLGICSNPICGRADQSTLLVRVQQASLSARGVVRRLWLTRCCGRKRVLCETVCVRPPDPITSILHIVVSFSLSHWKQPGRQVRRGLPLLPPSQASWLTSAEVMGTASGLACPWMARPSKNTCSKPERGRNTWRQASEVGVCDCRALPCDSHLLLLLLSCCDPPHNAPGDPLLQGLPWEVLAARQLPPCQTCSCHLRAVTAAQLSIPLPHTPAPYFQTLGTHTLFSNRAPAQSYGGTKRI